MPEFATFDDLNKFNQNLNEEMLLKKATASKTGKNTFLAHSSKDARYLPAVISVLENNGGNVYVDKGDHRLPQSTNRKTAEILRNTVRGCSRFVLFVTTNSKDSRWVPWELGLADGEKGEWPVALFPTADETYDQNWSKVEYLGLYQRIVWGKINGVTTKDGWIVHNHYKNTAVTLRKWITGA